MSRAILGIVIGILSSILYILGAGYCIYAITKSSEVKSVEVPEEKIDMGTSISTLIACLIMTIISILLILGITKKRHLFMAPWVYLSIAGIILNVILILISAFDSQKHSNLVFNIIVVAIQILIWYPIYTLYKDMRIKKRIRFEQEQQNVIVTATTNPVDTNYTQVPQNNI
ncbi:hypothetical protein FF38_01590 [Lucilia cuprina]|uniref:Uncharacterized protein n=1 Tax=Lucilia cuprina TaxID=7375 RepID=A0A0L0CEJ7_LUCCU|nr:hypothetical protein CVS40_2998 [Lucilia cuprina]KNC30833.1 hypothetical protein FF38_01590 [Lucilia cuprina]